MLLHDSNKSVHVVVLVQSWSPFGAEVLKLGDDRAQDLVQRCVSVFAASVLRHYVVVCWCCVRDDTFEFVVEGRRESLQCLLWV